MAQARKRTAAAPKQPQDHNPKKSAAARKAEAAADDGYVTVEQCGVKLRIPIGGETPLEAAIAFADGDDFAGTRLLLGEKQWQAFLAKKPTVTDYNEIGTKLQEATGN